MPQPTRRATSKTALSLFPVYIVMLFLALTPSLMAQLTAEDIEMLRQQGEEEGWTFEVRLSEAAQYPLDQLCGLRPPENWQEMASWDPCVAKSDLPLRFDWRDETGLPPIRNQGGCGSCWAFATVGALECAIHLQDLETVDLSEQYLVSCNSSGWGCDGGWWAHDYHQWRSDPCDSVGAVMEADYPYTASDSYCSCPKPHPFLIQDWGYIGNSGSVPSITTLKQALLDYGPLAVGIHVNSAFQAYGGGIFNGCANGDLNHGVVLVGWNDTLGTGCWIIRNSWGPTWGINGYMYIPYNCSYVGYGASYVVYNGGCSFTSDVRSGWVPLDVNFYGASPLEVDTWDWTFGDGGTGNGQAPVYTYESPGMHTVALEINAGGEIRNRERVNYIMALADTVTIRDTSVMADASFALPVRAKNYVPVRNIILPVQYDGPVDLEFDSVSTVGCRTDFFAVANLLHTNPNGKQVTIRLAATALETGTYLDPGDGLIAWLHFTVPPQSSWGESTTVAVEPYYTYVPQFSWPLLTWNPACQSGSVSLLIVRGNVDSVPGITVTDLTYLVNYLFKGGLPPYPSGSGDVDCDNRTNVNDLTYLVDYLFQGGPAPAVCP